MKRKGNHFEEKNMILKEIKLEDIKYEYSTSDRVKSENQKLIKVESEDVKLNNIKIETKTTLTATKFEKALIKEMNSQEITSSMLASKILSLKNEVSPKHESNPQPYQTTNQPYLQSQGRIISDNEMNRLEAIMKIPVTSTQYIRPESYQSINVRNDKIIDTAFINPQPYQTTNQPYLQSQGRIISDNEMNRLEAIMKIPVHMGREFGPSNDKFKIPKYDPLGLKDNNIMETISNSTNSEDINQDKNKFSHTFVNENIQNKICNFFLQKQLTKAEKNNPLNAIKLDNNEIDVKPIDEVSHVEKKQQTNEGDSSSLNLLPLNDMDESNYDLKSQPQMHIDNEYNLMLDLFGAEDETFQSFE